MKILTSYQAFAITQRISRLVTKLGYIKMLLIPHKELGYTIQLSDLDIGQLKALSIYVEDGEEL